MSTIDPVIDNILAAFSSVNQSRQAREMRLTTMDLGDLRRFEINEEEALDAVDRLVVCDVCRCIGDRGNARQGPVNQHDGTVPWVCMKHWPESEKV